MTDAELAQIAARLAAATPGPWASFEDGPDDLGPDEVDVRVCQDEGGKCICCLALMGDFDHEAHVWKQSSIDQWRADAAFIAHAPADMAALLAALRDARTIAAAALDSPHRLLLFEPGQHTTYDLANEIDRLDDALKAIVGRTS